MAQLLNVNFACKNPVSLARFWADTLLVEVEDVPEEVKVALREEGLQADVAAAVSDSDRLGVRLFFEREDASAYQAEGSDNDEPGPAVPATGGLGVRLDIAADDREAEIERLVGLGAKFVGMRKHGVGKLEESCAVMQDPEGNLFCVH